MKKYVCKETENKVEQISILSTKLIENSLSWINKINRKSYSISWVLNVDELELQPIHMSDATSYWCHCIIVTDGRCDIARVRYTIKDRYMYI